jgi:hypothetical protein
MTYWISQWNSYKTITHFTYTSKTRRCSLQEVEQRCSPFGPKALFIVVLTNRSWWMNVMWPLKLCQKRCYVIFFLSYGIFILGIQPPYCEETQAMSRDYMSMFRSAPSLRFQRISTLNCKGAWTKNNGNPTFILTINAWEVIKENYQVELS